MKKLYLLILIAVVIGAFVARLHYFHRPVADWHSWRQVDTSSVSRQFVKNGFDIFHPKFDDLSKGVSLIDNPSGHRFVEFPIYNVIQAGLYSTIGIFTLEEWGRLVTIISQLASIVFIYLILERFTSKRAGIIGAAFFAFVPFNVFYGRVILPDSSTVTAILASIYFFSVWIEKTNKTIYFILAIVCTAFAFLLKPYALFFTLPHIYLAYKRFGVKMVFSWQLVLFAVVSMAPLIAWRTWMLQYPEGIPQSNWLFNGDGIRFKGAFFHWLFADRIGRLILGYFGLPFVILGIISKIKKEGFLYMSLLFSCLLYMTVMAKGNVQHDYYQILIVPSLAIFFGKGVDFILSNTESYFNKYISYATIIVSTFFMLAFGVFYIRDYYNLQHVEVVSAGKTIDSLLPKNAKVIAPYGGDTTFLYYINRSGWPVFDRPLSEFVQQGASFMAFVNPSPQELELSKYFAIKSQGENYVLFDLTKPTPEGKEHLDLQLKKK